MPVCTGKVDSRWCHNRAKSHFLKQKPAQLFCKGFFFFKGPYNLFLFMEVVLEARASGAFVAWSCEME